MSANSSVSELQNGTQTGSSATHTGTDEPKNETQTETNGTQTGADGSQIGTQASTNGTQASTNGTQATTNGTQEGTNGTQTGTNGTQAATNGTQASRNGTQEGTNGTQTGTNGTQTETNSTQSDKTNETAGAGAHDPQPSPLLSIFFLNDLQYDIFPIHPENGSFCNTDQGKYSCLFNQLSILRYFMVFFSLFSKIPGLYFKISLTILSNITLIHQP